MVENKICVMIKYQYFKAQEIIDDFNKMRTSDLSNTTVYDWYIKFKACRTSTEDAERSGFRIAVNFPETIQKMHRMVMNDGKMKLSKTPEATLKECVGNILYESLQIKMLYVRWVPSLSTPD